MNIAFHEQIIQKAPFGYAYHEIVLDENGQPCDYRFLEVNGAFEEITELKKEKVIGQTVLKVIPGIKKSEFDWISYYGKIALEGGEGVFEQFSEPLKRWYKVHVYSPEKHFFVTIFSDITAEKDQTAILEKTEKRYRGLIESQNNLIVRVDTNNCFTYVNSLYCKTFGKTEDELLGKDFYPLIHHDDQEKTAEAMKDLLKPPYRCNIEQRAMTVNGWRWLAWEDNAILNERGEVVEVQGVGRDVTLLKEKEEALRKQTESLQTLLKETPAVIYSFQIVDGVPVFSYLSDNLKSILGYDSEAFYHNFEFWKSCIFPDDLIRINKALADADKLFIPGKEFQEEYRFKDANGDFRWLFDRQKVVLNQKNEIEIIGVWVDVTNEKQKIEELNQYKQRLSLAQTFAKTGSWEYDIEAGTLFWSKECEALFGLEEGSFEGSFESFLQRVHPDDREYVVEKNKPITELKEGIPLSYEHRIIKQTGEIIWVKETAGVVYDLSQKPSKVIGFIADISDQKIAAEAIENEEKLRQIVDNINGLFWLRSADRLEMLYVSPSIESLYGISQEKLYNNPNAFIDSVHPDDKKRVEKAMVDFLKTGTFSEEYRIIKPNGVLSWLTSTAFPVKNEKGETIRFAGIVNDITQLKDNEIALKAHADKLKALIDAMPDLYFMMDRQGNYLDVIAADPSVLLLPLEKVIGHNLREFFGAEEAKRQLEFYQICLNEERIISFEYQLDLNGKKVFFEARLSPVNKEMLLAVVRDVTEFKQLLEANKVESEFREFLFKNDRNGLVILDNEYKVIDVNPRFCNMTGYTADELLTMHTWDFDDKMAEKHAREGFDITEQVDVGFESRHRRKDGTTYEVEVSAISFYWKGERFIYCSCRDITEKKTAAKKLEASEKKFRQLVESINDVLFTLDEKGIIIYMSPAVKSITGYNADKYIGSHFFEFIHPNHKETIEREFEQLKSGENHPSEYQIKSITGEEVWVRSYTKAGENDSGHTEFRGIAQNITESRKAAIELKENEEKYRMLFNANNDSISIFYTNDDGSLSNFIDMNETSAQIIGYTREELLQMSITQIEEEAPEEVRRSRIEEILQKGHATFETKMRHKSGDELLMEVRTIFINYNGRPAILNIARDITVRKKTEDALKESEFKYRNLITNLNAGIVVHNPDSTILYSNPQAALLLGLTQDQLDGKDAYNPEWRFVDDQGIILNPDQYPVSIVIESRKPIQGIVYGIDRPLTHDRVWVQVNAYLEFTETDALSRIIITFIDITTIKEAQESLRKSEEFNRRLLATIPDLVLRTDLDGNIVFLNAPAGTDSLLHKKEDLLGKNILSFVHESDLERAIENTKLMFEKPLGIKVYKLKLEDGKLLDYEINGDLVRDAGNNPVGIVYIVRNITERKKAENAIIHGRQRLESFLEISRKITITYEKDVIMQMIVDNATRIMELGSGALYLQHDDRIINLVATTPSLPDDFHNSLRLVNLNDYPHIARAFSTGSFVFMEDSLSAELTPAEDQILKTRGLRSNLYLPINLRENTIGVLILSSVGATCSFTDEEIYMLQGFANQAAHIIDNVNNYMELKNYATKLEQQISQRKDAEKELRKFKIISDQANYGSAIADLEGDLLYVNDFFAKMHGWEASDLHGESLTILHNEHQLSKVNELLHELKTKGSFSSKEVDHVKKDGSIFPTLMNASLVLDEHNKPLFIATTAIDITEIKTARLELLKLLNDLQIAKEKAEESDKLKMAFLNNISHEIRTPLNGIIGFGTFLAERDNPPETRMKMLAFVENSSKRLINTITDYVDMARIVSNTMEVNINEFLLYPFYIDIAENAKQQCIEKQLEFVSSYQSDDYVLILNSDSGLLQRVLNILLDNAIKFTARGKICLGYNKSDSSLEFYVQDTGKGIAPEKLDRIFHVFTQEDMSNTRDYEGSGLGLSIASSLVKMLGGSISVQSELGKGSTFSFRIPYTNLQLVEKSPLPNDRNVTFSTKSLILVVENEEINYLYMKAILNMVDCNYLLAKNGNQAVEYCRQKPEISLVLMDIKMPVMNGLEATRIIREFRPDLPIIAITAYVQTGDKQRFIEAGFNDYLSKPIKREKLYSLIQKYDGNDSEFDKL